MASGNGRGGAARRRNKSRIFTRRDTHGTLRYYADLRSLGGRREALKPSGERRGRATSDPEVAEKLLADRMSELLARRGREDRLKVGIEQRPKPRLEAFAAADLVAKARAGKVTDDWLARTEAKLRLAVEFFGARRELESIEVTDVEAWLAWLQERPGRRGNGELGFLVCHVHNTKHCPTDRKLGRGRVFCRGRSSCTVF